MVDIRAWRAGRDRRYSRLWWTVFCGGCMAVLVSLALTEGVNITPWVLLGGLLGMILGRHRHQREQAARDARVDEQARQVAEAQAKMAIELAESVKRLAESNEELAKMLTEVSNASRGPERSAGDESPRN